MLRLVKGSGSGAIRTSSASSWVGWSDVRFDRQTMVVHFRDNNDASGVSDDTCDEGLTRFAVIVFVARVRRKPSERVRERLTMEFQR